MNWSAQFQKANIPLKTLDIGWIEDSRRGRLLDFRVSGRSLFREIRKRGFDRLPRTTSNPNLPALDVETLEMLLLEGVGDTPSGRVALYLCPCGDLGCDAVSVRIQRDGGDIVWDDFVWEVDYEDEILPLEGLGPFRFREDEYRKSVQNAAERR